MRGREFDVSDSLKRRHSRWYEIILFNSFFQFALGFTIVVLLPNLLRWEDGLFEWPVQSAQFNTVIANGID